MSATKTATSLGAEPANLDKHNADMAKRAKDQDGKRPLLLDCLDPTVAKFHEDRKVVWEWRVQVKIFRPAKGRVQAHRENVDKEVVAHNEADAWAIFCDSIGEWPSRRDSKPTITKLRKRTLRADDTPEKEE